MVIACLSHRAFISCETAIAEDHTGYELWTTPRGSLLILPLLQTELSWPHQLTLWFRGREAERNFGTRPPQGDQLDLEHESRHLSGSHFPDRRKRGRGHTPQSLARRKVDNPCQVLGTRRSRFKELC